MHHALNMEDDRPPVLVLMGESCGGVGGSIKLRLLFLTDVLDVLMYVVLLFVSLALLLLVCASVSPPATDESEKTGLYAILKEVRT